MESNGSTIEEQHDSQTERDNSDMENQNEVYPAAELIANTCKEEYMRLINTYDNIYNKVNILLVVCMVIFIAQADSFKGNIIINNIMQSDNKSRVVYLIVELCIALIALLLILGATVTLCFLLKSKKVPVLNCHDLRDQRVYEGEIDKAATYLIGIYTDIIKELNQIIERKQKRYDLSVILVVVSVVLFIVGKIM